MSETVILIPARGGSRGIPKKNLVSLCGKPLISWTVEQAFAANESGDFQPVLITDDQEIADEACMATLGEPENLAQDSTSMESVMLYVLEQLRQKHGWLILLQPTSPLRLAIHIREALDRAITLEADSLVSVTNTHKFIWGGLNYGTECEPEGHPKSHRPLRQTLHPRYAENGSIYVMRVESFLKEQTRFCGKTVPYVMPDWAAQEVDTLEDLEMVRLILADRLRRGSDGVRT